MKMIEKNDLCRFTYSINITKARTGSMQHERKHRTKA